MMSFLFVSKYNLYYLVFCVKQIKSSVLGLMTVQCMYDDIVFNKVKKNNTPLLQCRVSVVKNRETDLIKIRLINI